MRFSYSKKNIENLDRVLFEVCEIFGLRTQDVLTGSREQEIMNANHMIRYIMVNYFSWHYKRVAELLRRDKSTILASLKKAEALIDQDQRAKQINQRFKNEFLQKVYNTEKLTHQWKLPSNLSPGLQ